MEPIEEEPFVIKDVGIKPKKKLGIKQKIGIVCAVLAAAIILYPIMSIMMRIYNRSRYKDDLFLQKDVAKYLEDRYDEEFIVVFNRGMSGAYNYVQLFARPITNKTQKIQIQGYYNKKGKLDYYDDYVMIKLTDEYEAYLDPIIDEYFDDYKFYLKFRSEWITNNLPPDTKVEDLWELNPNQDYPLPELFVYVKNSEKNNCNETTVKKLAEDLQAGNYRGYFEVKRYEEDEFFDKRNRENIYKDIGATTADMYVIFTYDNKIECRHDRREFTWY